MLDSHVQSIEFPPEFDVDFYGLRHDDLANHDSRGLLEHYKVHGKREGRVSSPGAVRERFRRYLRGPALEIGPFYKPVMRGDGIKYFDILDTEGLRERAAGITDARPHDVPDHIHYVSPTGDLAIIEEQFPLVISSHCIEHQPDLIAHLNGVARILLSGGYYALFIPDYRYTFDHFLSASTLADVVRAKGNNRHTLESILQHFTLTTHNEPARHWAGDHKYPEDPPWREIIMEALRLSKRDEYHDVHAWAFCPENFRAIIEGLHAQGNIHLSLHRVYETPCGRGEFTAVLTRV